MLYTDVTSVYAYVCDQSYVLRQNTDRTMLDSIYPVFLALVQNDKETYVRYPCVGTYPSYVIVQ